MKSLKLNLPTAIALLTMASAIALAPTAVAKDDSPWQVRAYATAVNARDSFSVTETDGNKLEAGGNTILGVSAAIQYRFNTRFALEHGFATVKTPDIESVNDTVGEGPSFTPSWLGANFYVYDNNALEIYMGPRIAAVHFGDFKLNVDGTGVKYQVDEQMSYGAAIGLDYQFSNSRWSIHTDIMYLDVDMEISERGSGEKTVIGFDPIVANFGAAYRF